MSSCRTLIEPLGPGRLPKSALHDSKITFFSAGYLNFQEALHLSTVQPSTIFFTNFQYETYFCFCRLALQKHLNFTVSLRSKVTQKKVFWTETIFQKNKILSKPTFFRRGDTETHFQMFFSGFLGPPFFLVAFPNSNKPNQTHQKTLQPTPGPIQAPASGGGKGVPHSQPALPE